MNEWQSIETAPRQGKLIVVGCYDSVNGEWQVWTCDGYPFGVESVSGNEPTHWLPLPQPPQKTKVETKDLTEFEFKMLREMALPGSHPDLRWGAATGAALEFLQEDGYITRGPTHRLTAKGYAAAGWRTIETAPTDGAYVEVLVQDTNASPENALPSFTAIAKFNPKFGWAQCGIRETTHWRPRDEGNR